MIILLMLLWDDPDKVAAITTKKLRKVREKICSHGKVLSQI